MIWRWPSWNGSKEPPKTPTVGPDRRRRDRPRARGEDVERRRERAREQEPAGLAGQGNAPERAEHPEDREDAGDAEERAPARLGERGAGIGAREGHAGRAGSARARCPGTRGTAPRRSATPANARKVPRTALRASASWRQVLPTTRPSTPAAMPRRTAPLDTSHAATPRPHRMTSTGTQRSRFSLMASGLAWPDVTTGTAGPHAPRGRRRGRDPPTPLPILVPRAPWPHPRVRSIRPEPPSCPRNAPCPA